MNSLKNILPFIFMCLGALALGVLIYLPGLPGAFVFDDYGSISGNPAIDLHTLTFQGVAQAMVSAPVGGLLRPISSLSYVLDAHFFGVTPEPFKITNICIHVLVGVLLWFLARELLRAYRTSTGRFVDDCSIAWLSLAISTLWLVHPLNLTSVLYAVQRDNSLAALFTVAAVFSYMVGRRKTGVGGRLLIWLLAPLFTTIGLLCKENAALTPVFILVIEFTLLGFRSYDGQKSREAGWFLIVYLLLPLLAVAAFGLSRPEFFFSAYNGRGFTMYERLISESRVLIDYLRWSLIPDLRQLGLFHDDIKPSQSLLDPITTLPSLIAIAGLLTIGISLRRRMPLLSFGILWFFAGQLMESTVLPLELAFEHRNYLPLFGLIFGATSSLQLVAVKYEKRAMARVLLGTFILLFALTTAMRAADWKTELSFAQSESRHHPHSARALSELQWAYLDYVVETKDTRLIPLVLDAAEKSKAADPRNINQEIALAYMYVNLHDQVAARLHLQAAAAEARLAVPSSTLQLALQTMLLMADKDSAPLFDDMRAVFLNATQNPSLMSNVCYGAGIWNTLSVFQRKTEAIPESLSASHKAVTLCPWDPLMRTNFVDTLLTYGDTKDAGPQLDALRDVHSMRYDPEIRRLQQEYAEEIAAQGKK